MMEEIKNEDGLVASLLAKDRVQVSWKISPSKKEFVSDYFGKSFESFIKILRIYDVTSILFNGNNSNEFHEFAVPQHQNHWLIKGIKPNRCYCLELGIKLNESSFFPLLRSNTFETPDGTSINRSNEVEPYPSEKTEPPNWIEHVSTYSYYETLNLRKEHVGNRASNRSVKVELKSKPKLKEQKIEPNLLLHAKDYSKSSHEIGKNWSIPKILMLTWEFPPNIVGGLARHVDGISRSLVKTGCEIHVVTTQTNNNQEYELIKGVHVHRIKPLHEYEPHFLTWVAGLNNVMIDKVKELAMFHQFDVLHAHDWLVGPASLVLKKSLELPLVTTIHSTEFGRNNGIYTELQAFIHDKECQLVEGTNHLIVCSEFMKDEVQQVFHTSEANNISIIANGIDSSRVIESDSLNLSISPNKKIIFTIGRMVKEKGFHILLEAAPTLLTQNPNIHFVIAGNGPMLSEYQKIVKEKGLEADVTFVGNINEEQRTKLFVQSYLAVFPSLYEPFGIVSLESMILGKPTIVSNIGGLKGIVQHMKTGLLMEPGNPKSLIEQVQFLLNNESIAKNLGKNGKKIVERLYSWQRIAAETKRIYEDIRYHCKYRVRINSKGDGE